MSFYMLSVAVSPLRSFSFHLISFIYMFYQCFVQNLVLSAKAVGCGIK
jgi:hypothetical protein